MYWLHRLTSLTMQTALCVAPAWHNDRRFWAALAWGRSRRSSPGRSRPAGCSGLPGHDGWSGGTPDKPFRTRSALRSGTGPRLRCDPAASSAGPPESREEPVRSPGQQTYRDRCSVHGVNVAKINRSNKINYVIIFYNIYIIFYKMYEH